MSFLDPHVWTDSVFTGTWQRATGGVAAVVEPATGKELATVGIANAADIATACAAAAATRSRTGRRHRSSSGRRCCGGRGRCSRSMPPSSSDGSCARPARSREGRARDAHRRAGVLRGRGAGLAAARVAPADDEAAAVSWRARAGRRRGVISPFNFPLILVDPLGGAGARARQRRGAQAGPAHGGVRRRAHRPGVRGGRPAGRCAARCCRAAPSGQALVADPHSRVISFTGSTAAGRKVGEAAGRLLKRAHLELGGNNALIVLRRRRPRRAVSAAAFGSFLHQGQICMTTGRHLVHETIADEYVARLAGRRGLPVGDPATAPVALGPIIDAGQRDKVHDIVTRSVDAGARLAAGGDVRRACSTGRRCSTDVRTDSPPAPGDLRSGGAGRALRRRRRGGATWPATPSTGCRSASSAAT